ncbi:MAG: DUF1828 domain-containing protein [Acetobacteraceae bacterium]
MNYVQLLSDGFNGHIDVREKRPGVTKLIVPMFHEDGDMVDIFLEDLADGRVRISDRGLSLMRLSYDFDLDSENKERIFKRIIDENHVLEENGNLFADVRPEQLYSAVLNFGQTIAKIANMALYRREVIANLFYEMLDEKVYLRLGDLSPREAITPLPQREELVVDYAFDHQIPIYLFGIRDRDRAKLRLTAVSCLEFQKANLPFRSMVVHQDFEGLGKVDRQIITNAVDKQFTSLAEFDASGRMAIERLAA